MKRNFLLLIGGLIVLGTMPLQAQRYLTPVFSDAEVTITNNVQYAHNISIWNTVKASFAQQIALPADSALFMDVYQPTQSVDGLSERPLILYIPTGNFLQPVYNGSPQGSRKDSSAVNFAKECARRGYVCAVIDYRWGWNPLSPDPIVRTGTILNAAYRGQQDSKAAVRFFRADQATSNTFKVDPTKIVLVGEGTGGYIALAHAYLDKPSEIGRLPGENGNKFLASEDPDVSVVDTFKTGNFDGTNNIALDLSQFAVTGDLMKVIGNVANNPTYSSDVNLVINMGGALADISWINDGEIPMLGVQAVRDPNAPYNTGNVIVPTTGNVVIPDASGSGVNIPTSNSFGNNASFSNKIYPDAITAKVESYYNLTIPFGPGTIDTHAGAGLLPFILPNKVTITENHGSPWQFWSSVQPSAMSPNPFNPTETIHQGSIVSNPFMAEGDVIGRTKALAYHDTIHWYIHPRIVCALGLGECDSFATVGFNKLNDVVNNLMVAPNPSNGDITISSKSAAGKIVGVRVFDMTGKLIENRNGINASTYQIARAGKPAGIYLLQVQTDKGQSAVRIVFN